MQRIAAMMLPAAMLLAAGCGKEAGPPVPVYPVSGTVTYKGKPVSGADITFFNEEANRSAFGRTNDRGEYQLTTFSMNDGAVAGKQIITVIKVDPPPPTPALADIDSPDYAPPGIGEDTMPPPPKSTLPKKYADPKTTDLIAVVSPEGPNKFDFELKD